MRRIVTFWLVVLIGLAVRGTCADPPPVTPFVYDDAISREITALTGPVTNTQTFVYDDANSREISVLTGPSLNTQPFDYDDANSREITALTGTLTIYPETIITSPPEGAVICQDSVTFIYSALDDATPADELQYAWRIDGGAWSTYSTETSVVLSSLSHGAHTFEVVAKDEAGNVDPTPAIGNFSVDLAQPVISNVSVIPALLEATITWTTDKESTSQVEYGLTDTYGSSTTEDTKLLSSHSVTITGLKAGSSYHYRVKSKDGCGRETVSADAVFATTSDTTPPDTQLTAGPAEGEVLCSDSTTFNYTGTDDTTPTDKLLYAWRLDGGNWSDYSSTTSKDLAGIGTGSHKFEVSAKDASGNIDQTPAVRNFKVDLSQPVISDVSANPALLQAIITWTTDKESTSQVEYGATDAYGSATSLQTQLVTAHSVTVTGLLPNTTYHFRVKSKDSCERETASADNTFTTLADTTPPDTQLTTSPGEGTTVCSLPISFVWTGTDDVTPPDQLLFSWRLDNNEWSDWSSVINRDITELTDGTHTFEVKAKDEAGNVDQSPAIRHFTLDTTTPIISGTTAVPSTISCVITWKTNEPASSQVEYGASDTYGSSTPLVSKLVVDHSVTVSGLIPNTTYHFRVKSGDSCGHSGESTDVQFTTSADTAPPNTTITSGPSENSVICEGNTTFTYTGQDDTCPVDQLQYRWRMDSGTWSEFSSATSTDVLDLTEGLHKFEVAARDSSGNVDPTPAACSFSVSLQAPVMTNVNASSSTTQAFISWKTDKLSGSSVDYGLTTDYGQTVSSTKQTTSHVVTIAGLESSQTYHYRVRSTDTCGREGISPDFTFTTLVDEVMPDTRIKSGPGENGSSCSTTVNICWTGSDNTTPPELLTFSWKMDSGDWSTYSVDTCHEFTNLVEGDHTLAVVSKDTSGNIDSSPAYLHFRVDLGPPIISNISASAESTQATVTWATDEQCTSSVEYGLTDAYGLNSPSVASIVIEKKDDTETIKASGIIINNKVVVTGLTPDTTYHYRVKSKDTCGLESVSSDATFVTTLDISPPETKFTSGPPENGSACATTARFCWTGTDDIDQSAQLVYSWKLDSGDWSAYSTETCHDFESLTEGNHTVWVKARDTVGNEDLSPAYRHFRVDLTPPTINNVNAVTNATQATVTWLTVEGCTSQVEYGATESYGSSTSLNTALVTNHKVTVSGLNVSSTYHYRVKSKDACGQESVSNDYVFATTADMTGPNTSIVSGPSEGSAICTTSAKFCWSGTDNITPTDQLQFAWKLDTGPWSEFSSELCHEFIGLSEGNHTFVVSAKDSVGNEDPSPVYRHFRVDLSPPEINSVSAVAQSIQATIKWATMEPCNSSVEYGADTGYGSTSPVNNSMVTSHQVVLTGLEPETTYHYRVKSKDSCGMESVSGDYTFTTVTDTQSPDTSFTSGPADKGKACESVVQFCWSGSDNVTPVEQLMYSYKMDDADWSGWSLETCADFSNLSESLHTIMVKSRDLEGNIDKSPAVRYFFVDLTSPTISNVGATSRDTSASIAWNTSEPADSQVEYGNTPEYGLATAVDKTMEGKHDIALRGLKPESTYHYRVKSSDGCRQVVSEDYTFVTTAVQYPNLRIADVRLKGTCIGLQKIGFAWLVHNDGPGSAPGVWVDKVFLSTDDTLDSRDTLLGTFNSGGGLDWDTERWQNVTLAMPMASPGAYYLIVKTDYSNKLSETNEDDNVQVRPIEYLMVKQLTAAPGEINVSLKPGDTISKEISLTNLGELPLTGLKAAVDFGSPNVNVVVSAPDSIGGLSVQKIGYAVSASDESVQNSEATVKFTTAEGPEVSVKFNIRVIPRYPKLVVTPNYLETGMVKGSQALVEFEVMNQGAVSATDLKVVLPSTDWLSLVTPENIGELAAGASVKVGLALKPTDKTALGPYTGNIALSAANGNAKVDFKFTAVSVDTGSLRVRAEDEFTYFADGKPPLADATVKVTDPYSGALVAEGRTDSTGNFNRDGLKEGFYNIEVKADRHATYKGSARVEPGQVKTASAFLPRQLVTYSWKVVPVQTEDRYVVTLEAVFETHVPAPVMTVDPMVLDLSKLEYDADGKATVPYTITNTGFIAIKSVSLNFANNSLYRMTPLNENIGDLSAMSSMIVPVSVERLNVNASSMQASDGATSGAGSNYSTQANSQSNNCGFSGQADASVICGDEKKLKTPLTVVTGECPQINIPDIGVYYGGGWSTYIGTGHGDNGTTTTNIPSVDIPEPPPLLEDLCCEEIEFDIPTGTINDILEQVSEKLLAKMKGPLSCTPSLAFEAKGKGKLCCIEGVPTGVAGKLTGKLTGSVRCTYGVDYSFTKKLGTISVKDVGDIEDIEVSAKVRSGIGADGSITVSGSLSKHCQGNYCWEAGGGVAVSVFMGLKPTSISGKGKLDGKDISIEGVLTGNVGISAYASCSGSCNKPLSCSSCFGGVYMDYQANVSATIDGETRSFGIPAGREYIIPPEPGCGNDSGSQMQKSTPCESCEFGSLEDTITPPPDPFKQIEDTLPKNQESGICARVKVQLSQDVVISRNAFKATLEIANSPQNVDLTNLRVAMIITDDAGNQVNDLFGIHPPVLSGVGDVDGGGTIKSGVTATATWLIVPTRDAAPDEPTTYHVGGEFSYTQNGETITMPLFPAPILVKPDPLLVLDYFWVRDVYSDDPFTIEKEPSEPFPLGLMIRNNGKGVANNIRITSSQPKIIENEKGLLVDFKIIGTQVNSDTASPSLTVNFGNLDPGTTSVAKWMMTSSLQGKFSEYKASFEHIDGMGNPRLSLIDTVNIHELNHAVRVDNPSDDKIPDFLVNDIADSDFLPDTLYNSDTTTSSVAAITDATLGTVDTATGAAILTAVVPAGWVYIRATDPGDGYNLVRVVRSDGRVIRLDDNAWTTRRTIRLQGQLPYREHFVHIFDKDSTGSYTLYYKIDVAETSIANVKKMADGGKVNLGEDQGLIITGAFGNMFYMENIARTFGIQVSWAEAVIPGMRVGVIGQLGTNADFERYIAATQVYNYGTGTNINPWSMPAKSVGGGPLDYDPLTGAGQRGVSQYRATKQDGGTWLRELVDAIGMNNIGLLVKISGTVQSTEPGTTTVPGVFYVNDGSLLDPSDPTKQGVRVVVPVGITMPLAGDNVTATGLSSCYSVGNNTFRLIRVRTASDIEIYNR